MKSYIDLYHIEHLNYIRLFKLPNPPKLGLKLSQDFLQASLIPLLDKTLFIVGGGWLGFTHITSLKINPSLSLFFFLKFHHFIVRFEILLYNAVGNTFRLNVYQVRGRAIYVLNNPRMRAILKGV